MLLLTILISWNLPLILLSRNVLLKNLLTVFINTLIILYHAKLRWALVFVIVIINIINLLLTNAFIRTFLVVVLI